MAQHLETLLRVGRLEKKRPVRRRKRPYTPLQSFLITLFVVVFLCQILITLMVCSLGKMPAGGASFAVSCLTVLAYVISLWLLCQLPLALKDARPGAAFIIFSLAAISAIALTGIAFLLKSTHETDMLGRARVQDRLLLSLTGTLESKFSSDELQVDPKTLQERAARYVTSRRVLTEMAIAAWPVFWLLTVATAVGLLFCFLEHPPGG